MKGEQMARIQITSVDNFPALILTPEMAEELGVSVGDEAEVSIEDRTLTLRPLHEIERERKAERIIDDLMERRRSAYERLAEGVK
jgi:antitoxin component of MazEF toxin-antitoxin module